MTEPRAGKALANENKYPYIVEISIGAPGLDLLSRQILAFHKSRRVRPRHGRSFTKGDLVYSRWCFSELTTARNFLEQFGGAFYKITAA